MLTDLDHRPTDDAPDADSDDISIFHEPSPGRRAVVRLVLAALAVLTAAEGGVRLLERWLEPVHDWPDSSYTSHHDQLDAVVGPLDYLVIGSSSAGAAIKPDQLAEQQPDLGRGYTYWLAGPSFRSLETVTSDVLLDQVEPTTVVVGVTMREFNATDAHDEHLATLVESPRYLQATGQQSWLTPADDLLREHLALARRRALLRQPGQLWDDLRRPPLEPTAIAADGHMLGGEDERLADEPPEHLAQEGQALAAYTVSEPDVEALGELLAELDQRDITAIVVNVPVSDEFIELAPVGRADYERYRSAVEQETIASGAEWHDLMDHDWAEDDFRDVNHLNGRGAERLAPLLLDILG